MKFEAVHWDDVWSEVKVALYLFVESWGRFWSNRFRRDNDEVLYLRTELEKSRRDLIKLAELIKTPVEEPETSQAPSHQVPLATGFVPWRVRAAQLERESRQKLNEEKKSTEDLEKELGVANAIQQ